MVRHSIHKSLYHYIYCHDVTWPCTIQRYSMKNGTPVDQYNTRWIKQELEKTQLLVLGESLRGSLINENPLEYNPDNQPRIKQLDTHPIV
jgi:hypothetical protein